MSLHTKGEWQSNGVEIYASNDQGRVVTVARAVKPYRARSIDEETAANIRLMVRAPRMLALLKRFADLALDEDTPDALDVIDARTLVSEVES